MKFRSTLMTLAVFVTLVCNAQIQLPERGICAHRGAMSSHPENTIPAFMEAIRLGAHMIEFDVQITRDKKLVIMHDETVDRTTDGNGKISDFTFDQLRELDAGTKHSGEFKGASIPSLEEVLAIMPRNIWLNCHLKGGAEEARLTAQAIKKANRLHQTVLACGMEAAQAARQTAPEIIICNMEGQFRKSPDKYIDHTSEISAGFLQFVHGSKPTQSQIAEAKRRGILVNYFFAENIGELKELLDSGVNFVLVNELAPFMKEAQQSSVKPVAPRF